MWPHSGSGPLHIARSALVLGEPNRSVELERIAFSISQEGPRARPSFFATSSFGSEGGGLLSGNGLTKHFWSLRLVRHGAVLGCHKYFEGFVCSRELQLSFQVGVHFQLALPDGSAAPWLNPYQVDRVRQREAFRFRQMLCLEIDKRVSILIMARARKAKG
jgi:hypothetical protein